MITQLKAPCDEAQIAGAPPPAAPCVHGRWVLAATILGSAMAFIDGTVVNVALPVLQVNLNATTAGVQWVVEAYSLFLGALILVGGALGDRLGRRRIFMVGIGIFALSSLACGLAPTLGVLIVARAVQGVGAALLVPGSLAIISAIFPQEQRGRAIGTWSGFSAITTGLGPVLGGWLVQDVSWRAVFFINLPLALVVLAICARWVPETRDEEATGGIDWLGAALATLGLGGIVYGLVQGANLTGGLEIWAPIVIGALALLAFVFVEAREPAPMMPLSVFRSHTFVGANVLTLLLYGALGGVLFFVPFDLIRVQRYSPAEAGAAFLPFTVLMFLNSRWTGGLVDRIGARIPLVIGPALAACGLALFARPGVGGSYWATFFPAVVVLSLGMSIAVPPLSTAVMNAVSQSHAGVASGINNAASRVAGLLAIGAFGILVVQLFSNALDSRLRGIALPAGARQALAAHANRLVAIPFPRGLSHTQHAAVQHAVATAFVSSFRTMMLIAAVLALAGALGAATLIEGRPRRAPVQGAEPQPAPVSG